MLINLRNFIQKNPGITSFILENVRKTGFDIIHGPNPSLALLKKYGINLIFDVGANVGQFAMRTRALGYKGNIVSFEPLSSAYQNLFNNAARDSLWITENLGCGNYDGEALINISKHTVYSSMLKPSSWLKKESPDSISITTESIRICKIDSIFGKYNTGDSRVLLKIDTQGFEKQVLQGAENSLDYILGIQLELSFQEHYQGELLFMDILQFLNDKGFTLVHLSPLVHQLQAGNPLVQADGIFFRLSKLIIV